MVLEKLTLGKLKEIPARTIFASGSAKHNKILSGTPFNWVAVRGGIADWMIFYGPNDKDSNWIFQNGKKLMEPALIQTLVPCNPSVFSKYRF